MERQMAKRSTFTEQEIVYALKQVEAGVPWKELCRKLGVSEETFYRRRSKYGTAPAAPRVKTLAPGGEVLVDPSASPTLHERVIPLERRMTQFAGGPIEGRRVTI
jgi:hypothetical protein